MKKITIIGFIGADATTAVHQDKTVYNFSIGVQDDYKENGEWKKRTDWMQISYWQNKEVNYLKKGNMLYIEGTPHIHSY